MGFRFRKSINMGPFRVNLIKSGIGYGVGGKGARYTKTADAPDIEEVQDMIESEKI